MHENTYLILLSNTGRNDFLNHQTIKTLQKSGALFHFHRFLPSEPKTAFISLLTGCNPGKTGLISMTDDINVMLNIMNGRGFERSISSLLLNRGFPAEYLINDLPHKDGGFFLISTSDYELFGKVPGIIQVENVRLFLIAPVFEEYVEKAVNINSFLREKEIIATDSRGGIIWKNSLAYVKEYGELWINVIGREKEGAVLPEEEYNEVRESLIKGISEKLIDIETGFPVIERIYKKEELFSGEYLPKMPDLIVALKQGYGFSHVSGEIIFDESPVFRKRTKVYTAGCGILIGENIRENLSLKDIRITNIAPTALYCMGCKIPAWMDGKVEEQFFNKNFISDVPPNYDDEQEAAILSREDETLIKERLRGLGYL